MSDCKRFIKAHARTLVVAFSLLLPAMSVVAATSDVATVNLDEWQVSLANADLASGKIELRVTNDGSYTHALEIERNGEEIARTKNIPAGSTTTLSVNLKPGTYEFYCPIDNHRAKGMDANVKVSSNGMSVGTGKTGNEASQSGD